jgi:putative hydrolase of the HAD superfamily
VAKGLLLDIGGVVLQNGAYLVNCLAQREPRLEPYLARVSASTGIAGAGDDLWQQMLRHEVTERAYWAQRARELGRELGQTWDTRSMITALYAMPREQWLVEPVVDLMRDAKAAGLPLGALTNDLTDFHGAEWVSGQDWVQLFDAVVDASLTGVMKPAPGAYQAGADALGLAPQEIVYLDDMPWNVAGGLRAGLQAIEVRYADPGEAVAEARSRLGLPVRTPD